MLGWAIVILLSEIATRRTKITICNTVIWPNSSQMLPLISLLNNQTKVAFTSKETRTKYLIALCMVWTNPRNKRKGKRAQIIPTASFRCALVIDEHISWRPRMICDNPKGKVSSRISVRNRSAWLAPTLAPEPPSTRGRGVANDSKPSNYPRLFSNWLSINKIIIFKKNLTFFIIQNHRRPFFSIRNSCCFFSYYPFDLSKVAPLFTEPMPKQDKHPALLCFVFAPIS